MQITRMPINIIVLLMCLLAGIPAASAVNNPGQGRSLSIRFPAFSLSPGEKVSGVRVKTSQGRLVHSCLPGRWTCESRGNAIHCFSLHQSHAVALTGLLPELFIRDIPSDAGELSIEASVELLSPDGKESLKEFRESDLIIK
jgi:hypothetical protein